MHAYPSAFAVTSHGVYYAAPPHSADTRFVMLANLLGGNSRPVAVAHHPFCGGMSASPDGRYVLFDQADQVDRDLMMVKDFLSPQ